MDPAIITLCVLAVAAFLFVTELIPLAVTAMAACTVLGILGVLPAKAGVCRSFQFHRRTLRWYVRHRCRYVQDRPG
jgi:di/tricarboxylate transporter